MTPAINYRKATMTYDEARKLVEAHCLGGWMADAIESGKGELPETAAVHIYTWDCEGTIQRPLAGFRVAEVSYSTGQGSGGSYMGVEGLAVFAAVERVVIALVEGWPEEEIMDTYHDLDYVLRENG